MKYRVRISYGAQRFHVLTPDGGVIECKHEAAARRVADDMNALCALLIAACPDGSDYEDDVTAGILDAWGNV